MEQICPKCGKPRLDGGIECPYCGIVYVKFKMRPIPKPPQKSETPQKPKTEYISEPTPEEEQESLPSSAPSPINAENSSGETKTKPNYVGTVSLLIVFVLSIIYFTRNIPPSNAIHLDACEISKEYNANEIKAIARFNDQRMIIKGTVKTTGDSVAGLFLIFMCGNKIWPSVQCFFSRSYANKLQYVEEGQIISVYGKCTGKTMGVLMFNDCSIIYNKK